MAIDLSKFDFSISPTAGASAQLRSGSGASRSIPAYTPPVPSAPKPSSGGGSSSGGMQVGGWYGGRQWDGSRLGNPGEVIVGGGGGSSNSGGGGYEIPSGPSDEELNAMYEPLFNSLNEQMGVNNQTAQAQQQLIQNSLTNKKGTLATNKQATLDDISAQQEELGVNARSALSEALRAYQGLQQQSMARFGRQSSAGAAVGELVQQEFMRNQGKTFSDLNREEAALGRERVKAQVFYDDTLKTYELEADSQLEGVARWLRESVAQVNSQRGQLESERAAKKMDILQRAKDFAAEINNRRVAAQEQLNQWKQQQDYSFNQQLQLNKQNRYQMPDDAISAPQSSELSAQATSPQFSILNQLRARTNEEDDLDFLTE